MRQDMAMSGFAVLFVFIYLNIHLRSLFLSLMAITLIIFSFPVTMCIVRGIFRVSFFNNMQVSVIYIAGGIAADDIFVFVDAWRQSETVNKAIVDSKQKRMAYTWKRASRAMAVTSSTSAVAFLGNIFSVIMPFKVFGIFAGTIVVVNYLLVVFVFPSAVVIYEEVIAPRCSCCSRLCEK